MKLRKTINHAVQVVICAVVVFCAHSANADDPYCFVEAGEMYNVSAQLLWAISKVESNHDPKAINFNKNGSYDICHMQINSQWVKSLGQERWEGLSDPCYCTKIGAWILSQCVEKHGYTWEAVGCYHSPTKERQVVYADKVRNIILASLNGDVISKQ